MKIHCTWILTGALASLVLQVNGQKIAEDTGFELGLFRFQPIVSALAAYDTRVIEEPSAEADAYGEAEALLRMENTDARYDLGGWASYGYRAYDTYTELDDSFYGAGGNLASREGRLKTGLSVYVAKTLDYDTRIDGDSDLPEILSASTSHRASAKVDVGYERQLTEKSAIMPVYEGWYYYQDFEERPDDAEWQEHSAILRYGYGMSERMLLTLSGGYGIQINEEENGSIANVSIGAKSRATDKINWSAELGVSSVDYELSGTDEGFVGSLSLSWQATDKVSTYLFGGSEFQPGGAGRGARKVYRAGYGAVWSIAEKIKLDLQILHDYDDSIQGSGPAGSDDIRNFVTAQMTYDISSHIAVALSGSFIDDELEDDQTIISGRIVWSY